MPPVVAVLSAGIIEGGSWYAEWARVLGSASTWRTVFFSITQAAISAALAVVIALPGAYYLSHLRFPGRELVRSLTLVPFVLPTLVVVLAVLSWYGRAGLLNRMLGTEVALVYSPVGIVLAHVLFNMALAMRNIAAAWMEVDERFREASLSLGENGWGRFLHLHLPLITPAILNVFGVIFLYCFASFGVVLVFGGVRYATLEVRIYQQMFVNLNLTAAGALAALQLGISVVVLLLLQIPAAQRRVLAVRGRRFQVRDWAAATPLARVVCRLYWGGIALFFGAPFLGVVVRALRVEERWSVAAFRALMVGRAGDREITEIIRSSFGELVATSIMVAVVSAILTTTMAMIAARALRYRRVAWLDALTGVPLAISGVTVALGMWVLWSNVVPPLILLWLTQMVTAFPLVYRSARAAVQAVPLRYLESAYSLGASRRFVLTSVELPVLWRGIANAAVLAFALSMADFTTVLIVGRGNIVTFPVAMYRLIGFQSFDVALALGVCYIVIVALCFVAIDRTAVRGEEFGL